MKKKSGQAALLGLFLAFALILSYVESLIPITIGVPGVKLGLANLAVVLVLYLYGAKEAFLVDVLRILLTGFLFGNLFGILYSLAGGLFSFLVMWLCKKCQRFGFYGVSLAGGVAHNMGQLMVAAFVVETRGIYYYLPALLIAGCVMGFLIGLLAVRMYPVAERIMGRGAG